VPSAAVFKDFFGETPLCTPATIEAVSGRRLLPNAYEVEERARPGPIEADSDALVKELRALSPFFVQGVVSASLPSITMKAKATFSTKPVKSYNVTVPIQPAPMKKMWAEAKVAPFGRGTKTVVDPKVRSCRYLDPTDFEITSKAWLKAFSNSDKSELLESIRVALAPNTSQITAQLYKMVLYETGSFFKSHVDTQRSQDMFGTLVVEIGSAYQVSDWTYEDTASSGRLVVTSSDGRVVRMNAGTFVYSAFFADCEHEVLPLTEPAEYRVIMVYNLLRSGQPMDIPHIPNEVRIADGFRSLLTKYPTNIIAYLLSHQYGAISMGPRFLKGRDAEIFQALDRAPDLEVLVCPITVHMTGMCPLEDADSAEEVVYGGDKEYSMVATFPIDPLCPKTTGFGVLFKTSLETLKVHFLQDEHAWSERALARTAPTGNEGTTAALVYIHGAIFVKLRDPKNKQPKKSFLKVDELAEEMALKTAPAVVERMATEPAASRADEDDPDGPPKKKRAVKEKSMEEQEAESDFNQEVEEYIKQMRERVHNIDRCTTIPPPILTEYDRIVESFQRDQREDEEDEEEE